MNRTNMLNKTFGLSLLALATFTLGGCGEDRTTTNQDTLNPDGFYARFDPANGVIPFPNNLLFSGSTDGTLNIPVADTADYSDPQVALNALDGFSTVAPITAQFSSGIDSATLVAGETVRLFEATLTTGAVTAINSELIAGTDYSVVLSPVDTSNATISILPLRPLAANSSYLVTFSRGISDTLGNAANPELSYALAKGTTPLVDDTGCLIDLTTCTTSYGAFTDDDINDPEPLETAGQKAGKLELVRQLTNAAELAVATYTITNDGTDTVTDLAASDIVLSWSFTTQSIGNVLSTVWSNTLPNTITASVSSVDPATLGLSNVTLHEGTLDVPYYLSTADSNCDTIETFSSCPPLHEYWKNSDLFFLNPLNNVPVATTTQTVPLLMTQPNTGTMPAGGWPVVIFQHGITQDRSNLLAVADTLATAGFAAVAIDLPLHGITDNTSPLYMAGIERTFDLDLIDNTTGAEGGDTLIDESGAHFLNLKNLLVGRDNLRQGIVDLMTLKASLVNIANIDSSNVFFVGHSLGAMAGIPFLSFETAVQDAVLAMPGSGIPRLLDGSVNYGPEMEATLATAGVMKGSADYESFLTAAQTALDSADPINYTSSVGNNRGLLLFEVVGGNSSLPDQTIPNNLWPYATTASSPSPLAGTDPLAESLGLVKVDPADSTTTSGIDLQAWVRFNAGHHGSLLTPNDADGNVDALSEQVTTEMQSQMATFLATTGTTVTISDSTLIDVVVSTVP